ncbi:MAG: right-handed parallel beta-helix repeat-containing protein [Candidatus Omnitrophica bacterium]|nr:right-handed parallel beta-helix repeat-containing protein [Candidatus Omnitrophota bacterium]
MEKIENKNLDILYVSLNGDDSFTGRYPERIKNDGPFSTLQRAIDEILNIKKENKGILKKQILIILRGGTYFLKKPIEIKPEHSGSSKFPIIIMAYKNEKVIISAGEKIKNWDEKKINGKKFFLFQIENKNLRNFWLNGKRIYRARFPKNSYLKVAGVCEDDEKKEFNEGVYKFKFYKGDIKKYKVFRNWEVIFFNRWVESRLPVLSIDEEKGIIEFSKKTVFKPIKNNDLYYIENIFEYIKKNQWYFDYEKNILYFYPDKKIKKFEFIIPKFENVLKIIGNPEKNKFVENINFYNITFSHTEWYFPEESLIGGFPQAAVGVPGAIYCEGARNIKFENCKICNIGNYGIEFGKGCQNNKIINCKIYDLGAGGIKIGEAVIRKEENLQTFGNEMNSCIIRDGGEIFQSSVGIWIGQSFNNKILNNEIYNFYYTGISIGWTWGYKESLASGNIVKFNHIHHIGKKKNGDGPILNDMGGIYTLGIQKGTLISNNIFHDIYGYWYGGWGIYFDEGSSFIIAENNLVYNTTHGSFHQHYGKENIVRNNIFAFGKEQQIQISRPEQHKRFIFENNIVIGKTEKWIEGALDFNFIFDKNLYWNINNKKIKFFDRNGKRYLWEEWKEKGMDKNSIISDPLFYNIKKFDFRLKKKSPAFKLGFKKFKLQR